MATVVEPRKRTSLTAHEQVAIGIVSLLQARGLVPQRGWESLEAIHTHRGDGEQPDRRELTFSWTENRIHTGHSVILLLEKSNRPWKITGLVLTAVHVGSFNVMTLEGRTAEAFVNWLRGTENYIHTNC